MADRLTNASKFLSLILRHKPEAAGITLDAHGWADTEALIEGMNRSGAQPIDRAMLEEIVRTDAKGRYSFSEDGTKIRANQGHSIPVDVELQETEPPEYLWHGTADRFAPMIHAEGLKPMSRLYVHLSADTDTAGKVGRRHGKLYLLRVRSGEMAKQGYKFYLSANGVWLTKQVPPQFLETVG
ncbi:MAG: RNA 2'-phosphotransferase [Oscillospiraceae bacterium]|nr:RNA 2'-phosphotransferase [Oscillospiraceae bacterium]